MRAKLDVDHPETLHPAQHLAARRPAASAAPIYKRLHRFVAELELGPGDGRDSGVLADRRRQCRSVCPLAAAEASPQHARKL
jgi:hypothetical protein